MKNLLHIFLVLTIICSCEVDVTDEFRNQQNLFVVSGQVVAGQSPRINLSRTITLTELDTLLFLNEAQLEIRKNDTLFVLDPEGEGFYRNESLIPLPGDVLSLRCSGEELPPVSVVATVPDYPQISDLSWEVDSFYNFTLELTIEDPASTADYYSFFISGWNLEVIYRYDGDSEPTIDTSNVYGAYHLRILDPVLEYTGGPRQFYQYNPSEPYGEYFHFSDRMINGTNHTLTVTDNLFHLYNDSIPEIYVHLIKRDFHYYNFLESYIHYDPFPEQDFIQPVQVYSNIEGGYGLLTAEAGVIDTIDLSEWYLDPDFLDHLGSSAK